MCFVEETESIISGFKYASNDSFLESEIGWMWVVEARGRV